MLFCHADRPNESPAKFTAIMVEFAKRTGGRSIAMNVARCRDANSRSGNLAPSALASDAGAAWRGPATEPARNIKVYKLILDLTDGVSWPLSLQAAWLSSPA